MTNLMERSDSWDETTLERKGLLGLELRGDTVVLQSGKERGRTMNTDRTPYQQTLDMVKAANECLDAGVATLFALQDSNRRLNTGTKNLDTMHSDLQSANDTLEKIDGRLCCFNPMRKLREKRTPLRKRRDALTSPNARRLQKAPSIDAIDISKLPLSDLEAATETNLEDTAKILGQLRAIAGEIQQALDEGDDELDQMLARITDQDLNTFEKMNTKIKETNRKLGENKCCFCC